MDCGGLTGPLGKNKLQTTIKNKPGLISFQKESDLVLNGILTGFNRILTSRFVIVYVNTIQDSLNGKSMYTLCFHMILWSLLLTQTSCVKKAENMTGPTIGSLDIMADESMRDIIQQEEEIFERTYKYANVHISYLNEYDMFRQFFADSTDAIFTTRALTKEEKNNLDQHNIHPRQFAFAKGAIAFVVNKKQVDTTYTYEDILTMFKDSSSHKVFIIENAKSGISNVVMELINASALPSHFFALGSKKEVFDYVMSHDNAIGLVDWSDLSDSDIPETKRLLSTITLLGISRSKDTAQHGYVKPYQYNLQDDVYPFTRALYFISKTGMTDVGIGFASFITGEIGQKIILKAGLLPLFQAERVLELQNISDIKVIK